MIDNAIAELVRYALEKELIEPEDKTWAANRLLKALQLDHWSAPEPSSHRPLEAILQDLLDDALRRGLIEEGPASRDLLDTELMGLLTPRPAEVIRTFRSRLAESPEAATDWFYAFCQNTDYIRRYRIVRDEKWTVSTEYGEIDITVNLSKPEKDPRAIAAARNAPQNAYPACQLCAENEGYAGRLDHPARQNLRLIPLTLDGEDWFFQYSPYVYYNEHCIVLNARHIPMHIDRSTFRKQTDFLQLFPHYFLGSNADLPIVGGSILSHDHFQGGRYTFAMAKAPVEQELTFPGFGDVAAGIVRWPMSVLRLRTADPQRLVELSDRILRAWRTYSDPQAQILAETGGERHNTITPIARMRDGQFEMDLVLRNNRTNEEYPLGIFHPHRELHHIKKENIGLIEVMGLAVLPARLKTELAALAEALVHGDDLRGTDMLAKHADWAEELQKQYSFRPDNALPILRDEAGKVFTKVLEQAGVYKRTPQGKNAFLRFCESVH